MRSYKVDLGLRDRSHPDLIECAGEESGKGAAKYDIPVAAAESNSDATKVLLSDETLNVAIRKGLLVGEREGGVLGVTIQSEDAIKVLSKLDKRISISLTGGDLN